MPLVRTLLVVRADVGAAFRSAALAEWAVASDYIAATPCRRDSDPAGSPASHYVAHGHIPNGAFDTLRTILADVTQGVRDSVNWQGKAQGGALADARWAVAYDGTDIVAGYRKTYDDTGSKLDDPRAVLDALGLVRLSEDAELL